MNTIKETKPLDFDSLKKAVTENAAAFRSRTEEAEKILAENHPRSKEHPELMSPVVFDAISKLALGEKIGVTEIDPDLSDTAAFCAAYKMGTNQAANCVILEAKRADRTWFAACVILGNARADVNGLARRILDARKVSFAPMEKAVAESSMEYGAITPIGLPVGWSILVDQVVADSEYVIIGSGIRKTKLAVPGNLFATLPNVQVLKGLAKGLEAI